MNDPIDVFVSHCVNTTFDDLPSEVVQATKTFVLDTFGVGVAGSAGPWVDELIAVCEQSMPGDQARVWVHGRSLSAAGAAMCNGYLIHNSEFDCVHEAAVVHTVTVPLAAAMAIAERNPSIDGKTLITAIALGVDVACHLSVAVKSGLRFFRPATAGGMGAVASVGKLLGFNADQLRNAFGAMHGQLCGTMQAHTEGSSLLGYQIGFNARNAVMACDIAATGLVTPHQLLNGEFSYFALFEGEHAIDEVLPEVGKTWRITEVAHKPFPSGRATHGVLDASMQLKAEHGFSAGSVARVRAEIPSLVHGLVGRPATDDMHANYARLCIPYVVACALLNDRVGVADFEEPARRSPERLALAAKVDIAVDDNPDPNALTPVSVEIELTTGERLRKTVDKVYGNPARPMSREAQLKKLEGNFGVAAKTLSTEAMTDLVRDIDALERLSDVAQLVNHFTR
ncbi:MAG: MmgE/PrpD family protein [Pseudomonadota bacterium]